MSWSEPQLLRVLVYPVFLSDNTVSSVDPASNWQESPQLHHHAQAFLLADLLNLFIVGSVLMLITAGDSLEKKNAIIALYLSSRRDVWYFLSLTILNHICLTCYFWQMIIRV